MLVFNIMSRPLTGVFDLSLPLIAHANRIFTNKWYHLLSFIIINRDNTHLPDRSDTAALSDMGDDEVFEMSVGNSIAPSKSTKKDSRKSKPGTSNADEKERRMSKVSRSLEKSGKSVRYMAQAIKRSLNRSNQSSGSFSSGGNYAITLPSGVTKDVRGR